MRIRLRYSICLLALLATSALLTPAVAQEKQKPLPLEPARSLSMDLSEGTWMSADVSPDGETVVFDLMGDLFTVPMAGGDATQVTRGMAYDAQPKFSPDGAWLVFTSDRDGGRSRGGSGNYAPARSSGSTNPGYYFQKLFFSMKLLILTVNRTFCININ